MGSDSPMEGYFASVKFEKIVPAVVGFYVLSRDRNCDGLSLGRVRRNPVIAWGVPAQTETCAGWLEGVLPICLASIDQRDIPAILCPDGRVVQPDWGSWDSVDAWLTAADGNE